MLHMAAEILRTYKVLKLFKLPPWGQVAPQSRGDSYNQYANCDAQWLLEMGPGFHLTT